MKKFVSYIRVSTQKQGTSGLGLEAQRLSISNYVMIRGGEIVQEFQEVESGKKGFGGRPMLQAAIEFCKKNKCSLVLGKLDRLSRNVRFFLEVIETSKITICFADLPDIDPNTAEGRMLLINMATFAEFESRKISERTKSALAVVKSRGVKLGVKGAENVAKSNQIRARNAIAFAEKLRPIITGLSNSVGKNGKSLSLRAIAKALNESGVKTITGSNWTAVQVTIVLKRLEMSPIHSR